MKKKNGFTLKYLANLLEGELQNSDGETVVKSLVENSKHFENNSLFIAYKGYSTDSHNFIGEAFENGSIAAVVTDKKKLGQREGILVKNGYKAKSRLSSIFADEPSKDLLTFGITGTNGKTTIHWILYHILNKLGYPSIRIGSLGIKSYTSIDLSGKVKTKTGEIFMTTPGAFELQNALKLAVKDGMKAAVIETSSHALEQYRVADIYYDVAVFTNLTPDHLNFHKDMESYFQAKIKLFDLLAKSRRKTKIGGAVINLDDPYGKRLEKIVIDLKLPVLTFGKDKNADILIEEFKQSIKKSVLQLKYKSISYSIKTTYIGDYNASNLAAVFTSCLSIGLLPDKIVKAFENLPSVPGRLESVGNERIGVFVDYAHTGVGLESVLSAVKGFVKNNLWVVFGCGGGKDHGKRPAMGKAAMENADKIVLTNDNPKNEKPEKIIKDILTSGCKPEFIELDRKKAIKQILKNAKQGDVIILAGKGHEDYQIIGNKTIPFSDRDEVLKLKDSGVF